ncbi:hypothetical protein O6H91_Y322900 [Diphasiastrum complanatum]|nr:hypothetical protein O6H91_Y322900 [Diphasiastrum complanatum]
MVHMSESEGIEGRTFVVTGGTGFPGATLCLELVNRGAGEVRAYDVSETSPWLSRLRSKGVKCIIGDIRNKEDVKRVLKGADCVFHLASSGMSGKEMLQSRFVDEVNLNGTCNVLDSCIENGVQRLVYTSTYNVVFGGQEIVNGNEAMPYFPIKDHVDSYGRSKALAEQLVLKSNGCKLRGSKGQKLNTCAVRPAAIYGPEERRHFPRILAMAQLGLLLFRVGGPDVRNDWLYIDNFVNAQLLASMALLIDVPGREGYAPAAGQAYFISDGAPVNSFKFLQQIVEGLGYSYPERELSVRAALVLAWFFWGVYSLLYPLLKSTWMPEPFLLPAEVYKVGVTHYFSLLKAREELGYVPLVDQKEGIRNTLAFFKEKEKKGVIRPLFIWWFLIVFGFFALFCCAFVPRPFLGPMKWLQSLGILLHGSVKNLQIVFFLAWLAHLLEASYAWRLAKKVDTMNAKAWFEQTLLLGYPSLRLLLKRSHLKE